MAEIPKLSIRVNGPPIQPQTEKIFGYFNKPGVVSVMLTNGQLSVGYADGTTMLFTPSFEPSTVN